MTDINKQIEEEAREYAAKKSMIAVSNVAFNAYNSGYKSALYSSRWRKVSEELPEDNKDVLVKVNIYGYVHFGIDRIIYGEWMNGDDGIIEWKHID